MDPALNSTDPTSTRPMSQAAGNALIMLEMVPELRRSFAEGYDTDPVWARVKRRMGDNFRLGVMSYSSSKGSDADSSSSGLGSLDDAVPSESLHGSTVTMEIVKEEGSVILWVQAGFFSSGGRLGRCKF